MPLAADPNQDITAETGHKSDTLAVGGGADDTRRRAAWDEFVAQTLTGV